VARVWDKDFETNKGKREKGRKGRKGLRQTKGRNGREEREERVWDKKKEEMQT
jgi:hypothetical protein